MNSVNGTEMKYLKNSHSSYLLQVHIIFVTKYRELHSGAQVTLLAQLAVHQYRFLSNTSSSKIDPIRLLRNLGYPSRAASCGAFRRFWVIFLIHEKVTKTDINISDVAITEIKGVAAKVLANRGLCEHLG